MIAFVHSFTFSYGLTPRAVAKRQVAFVVLLPLLFDGNPPDACRPPVARIPCFTRGVGNRGPVRPSAIRKLFVVGIESCRHFQVVSTPTSSSSQVASRLSPLVASRRRRRRAVSLTVVADPAVSTLFVLDGAIDGDTRRGGHHARVGRRLPPRARPSHRRCPHRERSPRCPHRSPQSVPRRALRGKVSNTRPSGGARQ